jgi:hypothetical protein
MWKTGHVFTWLEMRIRVETEVSIGRFMVFLMVQRAIRFSVNMYVQNGKWLSLSIIMVIYISWWTPFIWSRSHLACQDHLSNETQQWVLFAAQLNTTLSKFSMKKMAITRDSDKHCLQFIIEPTTKTEIGGQVMARACSSRKFMVYLMKNDITTNFAITFCGLEWREPNVQPTSAKFFT